jgi:hypothetical protein
MKLGKKSFKGRVRTNILFPPRQQHQTGMRSRRSNRRHGRYLDATLEAALLNAAE